MATFIFDFDSTLISCESLEVILEERCTGDPALQEKIRQITEDGIRGKIPFAASLAKRLAIAAPNQHQVASFGGAAHQWLTAGMEEYIAELQEEGDVWIVSGALIESILPLGERLNIPEDQMHGVRLLWGEGGVFEGIDETVPFCRSKVEGCQSLSKKWSSPVIAVGDSMSDYNLFSEGVVEHFVAFTEHFRCEEVLQNGVAEAANVKELRNIISDIV